MTAVTRPLPWLAFATLALVLAVASFTTADPDLWGHVRFGLNALRAHHLTSVDPYSFTQDVPWINHEWLSELQMGAAWTAFGSAGLSLLKGSLATIALWLVWQALGDARFEARLGIVLIAAIAALSLVRTLRPQLWSVVCLAIVCRILVSDAPARRWWLPLVFAVWANLHGGWIVGLGVLGAWLSGDGRRPLAAAGLLAACVVATMANPYGWSLWGFLWRTVNVARPNIEEWMPLWSFGPELWIGPLLVAMAIGWVVARPFPGRRACLVALVVLALAGLRVARVAPMLGVAAAILLAPRFAAIWPRRPFVLRTAAERWTILIATLALAVAASAIARLSFSCIPIDHALRPDPMAVALLKNAPPGRLVTFFNWGEYAIWHFGPNLRVSMDGRRETVYSDRRIAEHDGILRGSAEGFAALAEWQPEYVWLPAASGTTRHWLEGHGYRIAQSSEESFVAIRGDLRVPLADAPPASACFPD
jgi:hypothetical protein